MINEEIKTRTRLHPHKETALPIQTLYMLSWSNHSMRWYVGRAWREDSCDHPVDTNEVLVTGCTRPNLERLASTLDALPLYKDSIEGLMRRDKDA